MVLVAAEQTICQQEVQAASSVTLPPGAYVPQCDENGEYRPLQFHASAARSWCVTREGIEIPGTRTMPGLPTSTCSPFIGTSTWGFEECHGRFEMISWLLRLSCPLLSGVVVNALAFGPRGLGFALPLFYWVAALGKLFTHTASPVFSAPRNWGTKGSIRSGPINGLTDWVRLIKLNGGIANSSRTHYKIIPICILLFFCFIPLGPCFVCISRVLLCRADCFPRATSVPDQRGAWHTRMHAPAWAGSWAQTVKLGRPRVCDQNSTLKGGQSRNTAELSVNMSMSMPLSNVDL